MSLRSIVNKAQPKIMGIAMNYPSPTVTQKPKEPIFFTKTHNTLCMEQTQIKLSAFTSINYEIELGVELDANRKIKSYFLGLDLTSSEIANYRKDGKAFDFCKNLNNYLPVSESFTGNFDWKKFELLLKVNGNPLIQGLTHSMFYPIEEQIAYVDKFMPWNEGDLLLTGTPGIKPLTHGDHVEASLLYEGKIQASIKTQMLIENYIDVQKPKL